MCLCNNWLFLKISKQKYLTKRYDEANEAVTTEGIELENTSLIMGLATDINPMPPVHNIVEVENNSQNCGVFMTVLTLTLLSDPPVDVAGGVQP